VLQSIQNTSVKSQQAVGTGKRPDESVCENSAANYANRGVLSENSQNVVSKCDAGSMPSSTSCTTENSSASGASARNPQSEMLVFYVDYCF